MQPIEVLMVVLLLVVLIRNFRKDKSDGRDPLGGRGNPGGNTGRQQEK